MTTDEIVDNFHEHLQELSEVFERMSVNVDFIDGFDRAIDEVVVNLGYYIDGILPKKKS